MKELTIYLRPEKLEVLKELLRKKGCHGMSVMSVMGCGIQNGDLEPSTKGEYKGNKINLIPKICVNIVVSDDIVDDLMLAFYEQLSSGVPGDGKVFVKPIENAMRIRTGEKGTKAL